LIHFYKRHQNISKDAKSEGGCPVDGRAG